MLVAISDVVIFSLDEFDDTWEIAGEITFEGELTTPFEVTYLVHEDELDHIYIEIEPGLFDKKELKTKMLSAIADFEE